MECGYFEPKNRNNIEYGGCTTEELHSNAYNMQRARDYSIKNDMPCEVYVYYFMNDRHIYSDFRSLAFGMYAMYIGMAQLGAQT